MFIYGVVLGLLWVLLIGWCIIGCLLSIWGCVVDSWYICWFICRMCWGEIGLNIYGCWCWSILVYYWVYWYMCGCLLVCLVIYWCVQNLNIYGCLVWCFLCSTGDQGEPGGCPRVGFWGCLGGGSPGGLWWWLVINMDQLGWAGLWGLSLNGLDCANLLSTCERAGRCELPQ